MCLGVGFRALGCSGVGLGFEVQVCLGVGCRVLGCLG